MAKHKIRLAEKPENLHGILSKIASAYPEASVNMQDGMKLDFVDEWIHVRPSNTEPIFRIYTEAKSMARAEALAETFKQEIRSKIDTL